VTPGTVCIMCIDINLSGLCLEEPATGSDQNEQKTNPSSWRENDGSIFASSEKNDGLTFYF